MFKLEELTEVELEDYVKQSFGHSDEYLERKKYRNLLRHYNTIISLCKEREDLLHLAKNYLEKEKFEASIFYTKDALKKENRILYQLRNLLRQMGAGEESYGCLASPVSVTGSLENHILHLVLPELLPDKVQQGEAYRYSEITAAYLSGFQHFFSKGRFPIYEQKAVLVFVNYYQSEQDLKDHDNFETKQIIDILSAFLLPDDNPKWCAHYMDYKLGATNHTEIYVVPFSQFLPFFQTTIAPAMPEVGDLREGEKNENGGD